MTEGTEQDVKKDARVSRPGKLVLRKTVETGQVRQSFSHGRSKTVTVEVRRKRTFAQTETGGMVEVKETASEPSEAAKQAAAAAWAAETETTGAGDKDSGRPTVLRTLTDEEKGARARAFETARRVDQESHRQTAAEAAVRAEREAQEAAEREAAAAAGAARKTVEEEESRQKTATQEASAKATEETRRPAKAAEAAPAAEDDQEKGRAAAKRGKGDLRRPGAAARRDQPRRRAGKLTIGQALNEEDRVRSLASVRRARDRERGRRTVQPANKPYTDPGKVVREVVVPETITVQELANRMAVRGAGLIKSLMKMGTMCTITQSIDADTAELLVHEFGHTVKRVTAADIEVGLKGEADAEETLKPRPPVVTVMGHVDHGKTSLLDALRSTDVVSGEAGGITQHIGAYHVTLESGDRITFIDTPGHAAFTAMRGRGASCTDIVVLVVAADDGVMPQTIEAINHAKAADVPIIVAINKMDRPDANGDRVRNELLQHGIVVEEMGGEVLSVEISALKKLNLDKLTEAIHLQAELLDLTANPDRPAEGVVVEAKLERGRGPVATVLVQRGTLRVGDIVVAGGEWARVRALFDERGNEVKEAGPSMPVEIIGLSGVPNAGEDMMSVENEKRAREVAEYRQERVREIRAAAGTRGTLEQMFADISSGEANEMAVVIKADVQGSVEALAASLEKLSTDEVAVRVLHTGVGGINESDVTLAQASGAVILGFNVRANAQARTRARADNIEIRYYSIIYNVIDDVRAVLSGMLAPDLRERIVGNAQVLEVFDITKLGKIAGCRVTDGLIKRGATVRLLRDDTVIFEGRLATLKRFKEDAREVKEGLECGMSFENYHDLRTGDIIEAVEIDEIARTL